MVLLLKLRRLLTQSNRVVSVSLVWDTWGTSDLRNNKSLLLDKSCSEGEVFRSCWLGAGPSVHLLLPQPLTRYNTHGRHEIAPHMTLLMLSQLSDQMWGKAHLYIPTNHLGDPNNIITFHCVPVNDEGMIINYNYNMRIDSETWIY